MTLLFFVFCFAKVSQVHSNVFRLTEYGDKKCRLREQLLMFMEAVSNVLQIT